MSSKICTTLWVTLLIVLASPARSVEIPRTIDGKPDLSGTYDITTATPLERPAHFGTRKNLTAEEVTALRAQMARINTTAYAVSDPDRGAPPMGGDGSGGPRGNVGGYNLFYITLGDGPFQFNNEYRNSILLHPENGRRPEMQPNGKARMAEFNRYLRSDRADAWWLEEPGPGPFDDPERLAISDRCLLGRGVNSGPPVLPTVYNNLKRIVQTPDYVMILVEMNHDARIVRMNSEHVDPSIRRWLGDSIGWWEDDTLVVDTINFNDTPSLIGASRNLHVVERFTRLDEDTLHYSFKVDDPDTWAGTWSGDYPWPATTDQLYEYACHEGNYAMGGILRGARTLEKDALSEKPTTSHQ